MYVNVDVMNSIKVMNAPAVCKSLDIELL